MADLDQPITQLTTTSPPDLTAESMKELAEWKYLRCHSKEAYDDRNNGITLKYLTLEGHLRGNHSTEYHSMHIWQDSPQRGVRQYLVRG